MSAISGTGGATPVDTGTVDDDSGTGTGTSGTVDRTGGTTRPTPTGTTTDTTSTEVVETRYAEDAKSYIEGVLARLSTDEAAKARALLVEAATLDANEVVSRAEAERALGAVLDALPDGGRAIEEAIATVDLELDVERLREADIRDGVDVLFNSDQDGPSITGRILDELDAAVAEAGGRRLDVNIMIFSFTDPQISAKLLDVCRSHPNVNVKIIADWTQTTTANGYKPAELARAGLPNLEVKFKKDQPYRWDAARGALKWDHGVSRGLNHHKGFVTLIDGRPRKLVTGSFNWSPTAQDTNYENLMVLDGKAAANRSVMRHYEEEFEAYWNDGRASLTLAEAADHKRRITRAFEADPRVAPSAIEGLPGGAGASISLLAPEDILDLNGWTSGDRIASLFGGGQQGLDIARAMQAERLRHGRFADLEDLLERVPQAAAAGAATLEKVKKDAIFGDALLSVNDASAEELMAVGLTRDEAAAILTTRADEGDFASIEDVREAAGIAEPRFARLARFLTDDVVRVSFSARMAHEPAGDTGYARSNETRTVPVLQPDGSVALESASLGAGAVDIIRAAKSGETIKCAVYGLSANTPEYAALVEAARRGVKLRVILNKAGNEPVAAGLRALATAEGLDIAVKVSGRTMHQKYLVHVEGKDAFNGSANLSGSSSTRHSEDRFFVKNNAALAKAFETDFDRLWARLIR